MRTVRFEGAPLADVESKWASAVPERVLGGIGHIRGEFEAGTVNSSSVSLLALSRLAAWPTTCDSSSQRACHGKV